MIFEQAKLDAIGKKHSNIFNWRGQFTPEFVLYILQLFSKENDFVLDPFSGSGTVLQEAIYQNLYTAGFDINPSAYMMTRFFELCRLDIQERYNLCFELESKINFLLSSYKNKNVYIPDEDYRKAYTNLLELALDIKNATLTDDEHIFLVNILFLSEKDKKLSLKDSIYKSFYFLKEKLIGFLPYSDKKTKIFLDDSRNVHQYFSNEVDLILSSPPYINVFNYHQNYRGIMEVFDYNILSVAHSEFGANRKNRSNRFKTVVQYCLDMEQSIKSFWKVLKEGAKIILVLGRESNVRNIPFYNGQMIKEIIEECKGFSSIETLERSFKNKFGMNITEDIIIATKTSLLENKEVARKIAKEHLQNALPKATSDIEKDMQDVLNIIDDIECSPLFNKQKVSKYELYPA
jgi:DNA methylase N-4/N-6 domain protein